MLGLGTVFKGIKSVFRGVKSVIGNALHGVGWLINILLTSPWQSITGYVSTVLNACGITGIALSVLTVARSFLPIEWRVAATVAAPFTSTIAPGVVAQAISVVPKETETPEEQNMDIAAETLGAAGSLALAAQSAAYTPMLAAAINGPVCLSWFAATTAVSAIGGDFGRRLKNTLFPST